MGQARWELGSSMVADAFGVASRKHGACTSQGVGALQFVETYFAMRPQRF